MPNPNQYSYQELDTLNRDCGSIGLDLSIFRARNATPLLSVNDATPLPSAIGCDSDFHCKDRESDVKCKHCSGFA